MTAATFDTHLYVKLLRERGVPENQAEAFVEVVTQSREADLNASATKADLRELELKLENHLKDMQIKLGGMIVALGGVLIAVKYFG